MEKRKYLELSPEEAQEYALLARRMEWLELKNSIGYRVSGSRRDEIDAIYTDVSHSNAFADRIRCTQLEPTANSTNGDSE